MKKAIQKFIQSLGEEIDQKGVKNSPERYVKMLKFLTKGYKQDIDKIINNALYPAVSDEMVILKNIELYSLCEHHLLPFLGKCHVAYIPNKTIIGLSKIARIVDVFARRLQVQERLTARIAETLLSKTDAQGVGVVIEAQHLCMMMRGVEKQNSKAVTSCMLGVFRKSNKTRAEFINLINKP